MAEPEATLDPAAVRFSFCLQDSGGGALVAGYSGSTATVKFAISAQSADGTATYGYQGPVAAQGGKSEVFLSTDPCVYPTTTAALTGPLTFSGITALDDPGFFLARFQTTGSTILNIQSCVGADITVLPLVNEMLLTIKPTPSALLDSTGTKVAGLVGAPSFTYQGVNYADVQGKYLANIPGNLTVGGVPNALGKCNALIFAPASIIGKGVTFNITGGPTNSISDPVTGNDVATSDGTNFTVTAPSTWVAKNPTAWIAEPLNGGLSAAIDYIVAQGATTQTHAQLVTYFQNFFIKQLKANPGLLSPTGIIPGWLGGLNSDGGAEIIALDDVTTGPLSLANTATTTPQVNLIYDASESTYSLTNGIFDLQGKPPVKFDTSIAMVPSPVITSFVATPCTAAAPAKGSTPAVFAVPGSITPTFTNGTGYINGAQVTSGVTIVESPVATTDYTLQVFGVSGLRVTSTATVTVHAQ
jgi:hypothetical protein